MLFLGKEESKVWSDYADRWLKAPADPSPVADLIRPGLIPAFHYFMGTLCLAKGQNQYGRKWITAGLAGEQGGLFSNAFLLSYLGRNNGQLVIPETIFADPAPYVHFAGTPVLVDSRKKFRMHCAHTLPVFSKPLRIMDIGCGHGMVLVDLLLDLRREALIADVEEILLIDPSEAMLNLAEENVSRIFPGCTINLSHARIEDLSDKIVGNYDIALASLAYHHMPYETKLYHLQKLKNHIGCFILFELEANNDTPELLTPEMALSVYQSYGSLMDFVFEHDAPVELAISSIDRFLMSEAIYFFTEPRGKRTDYHMLRSQWHQVFLDGLGKDFSCLCDSTCFGDENIGLFTMIYSKVA
ncbi:MAG: class I SAM-dependent methyltransferase [Bacteroidales bacterium]|jgi:SAM-dependent methyltransferase|nr:class I SAM-dependent methyltransferase [Bacteroidales bacterium]